MTEVDELMVRVRDALADTPYTVTRTERGFDVAVELHRRSEGRYGQRCRTDRFRHEVAFDPAAREFTVTDVGRRAGWTPEAGQGGRTTGRSRSVSTGRYEEPWARSFDSEWARRRVVEIVVAAGWTRRMSRETRLGLIGAGIGLLIALGVGVGALLVFVLHVG